MAKMISIDPALTIPLTPGWELVVTEAGRFANGLRATVQLMNGTVQACDSVALADSTQREAFAQLIAYITKVSRATAGDTLLTVVGGIEGLLRQETEAQDEARQSQATRLIELALAAGVELFHTPEGDAYATITVADHKETWPLKVKAFRRWLARLFYETEDKAPGAQGVQDALGVLEGKGLFDGSEHPVYSRLAEHEGALYLDLGDEAWRAVQVTTSGWQVVVAPPSQISACQGHAAFAHPGDGR